MLIDLQATNSCFENPTDFHYIIFQISPFYSSSELQATHLLGTEAGLVYSIPALSFYKDCSRPCCLPVVLYWRSAQQQGTRPVGSSLAPGCSSSRALRGILPDPGNPSLSISSVSSKNLF